MTDLLLSAAYAPFTVALTLLFALLGLEILFAFIGLSMMGEGPDLDLDAPDVPDMADLGDIGVDTADIADIGDYDIPDMAAEAELANSTDTDIGALAWLGFGKVPFILWLACGLLGFGLSGVIVQSVSTALIGTPLFSWIAVPIAVVAGIWVTRSFSATFARLLPKTETSAISTRRFGGHKGVVSQGVSRRGHPAEVRLIDRFGNFHYLRAEPMRDDDQIKVGTDVIVFRNMRTGVMRLIPLA